MEAVSKEAYLIRLLKEIDSPNEVVRFFDLFMDDSKTIRSPLHFDDRWCLAIEGIFGKPFITEAAVNMNETQLIKLRETLFVVRVLVFRLQATKEIPLQRSVVVESDE